MLHRIYNFDKTRLIAVQSKCSKILALQGRRQVGSLTSTERSALSTIVVCLSAGGNFVLPMIIFPRVRMKDELQDGSPPGIIFHLDIFIDWFKHTKPTAENPVLLVFDGYIYSHDKYKFY